jgi:hypothetical protein
VASIREGLEIFAGELEAVIRELPELEGLGGCGVYRQSHLAKFDLASTRRGRGPA